MYVQQAPVPVQASLFSPQVPSIVKFMTSVPSSVLIKSDPNPGVILSLPSFDEIISELNKDKTNEMPYYFSDMLPSGGKKINSTVIEDVDQQFFALSSIFSLSELITERIPALIAEIISDSVRPSITISRTKLEV